MNTPVSHRFVALILSVVLSLGMFETLLRLAAPEHASPMLVRAEMPAALRG